MTFFKILNKQVAKLNLLATNLLSKIDNSTIDKEIQKITNVVFKPTGSTTATSGNVINKSPPYKTVTTTKFRYEMGVSI